MSVPLLELCDTLEFPGTPAARAVLRFVCWKARDNGTDFYYSVRSVCRATGLADRTVRTAFRALADNAWIASDGFRWIAGRRVNRWRVNVEYLTRHQGTPTPEVVEGHPCENYRGPLQISQGTPADLAGDPCRSRSQKTLERPGKTRKDLLSPRVREEAGSERVMIETPQGPCPANAAPIPPTPLPVEATLLERLVAEWARGNLGGPAPSDYDFIGDALAHLGDDADRVREAMARVRKTQGRRGRARAVLKAAQAMVREGIEQSRRRQAPKPAWQGSGPEHEAGKASQRERFEMYARKAGKR